MTSGQIPTKVGESGVEVFARFACEKGRVE